MKDFFWITIGCIKGVGSKTLIQLYKNYPHLTFDNLNECVSTFENKRWKRLFSLANIDSAKQQAENMINIHKKMGIEVIPISHKLYPKYLQIIEDPPTMLYAKGNLDLLTSQNNLAIVGTRKPTKTGITITRGIVMEFSALDYTIVSGLALGIDTAAHESTLKADLGKTIAVLAGSLANIYPAANKQLATKILKHKGLLLSETPIGQATKRGIFVRRNRILSGLSLGICPVQTPITSGTQHTISFARKQGRFLFTPIPHQKDIHQDVVQGNLELIKSGVTTLENAAQQSIHSSLLNVRSALNQTHREHFPYMNIT